MSRSQYHWNIFKMMIIWTTTVFATFLIIFQLKYLKGNIFDNIDSYTLSDAASLIFGGIIYTQHGLKRSLILSYSISLIGGIGICFFQS